MILQDPGCDVNATTSKGWTAMHLAARSGFTCVIEALIQDGRADPHQKNGDGQTALHIASDCHHTTTASYLLDHGGASSSERERALARMELEERTRRQNDVIIQRSLRGQESQLLTPSGCEPSKRVESSQSRSSSVPSVSRALSGEATVNSQHQARGCGRRTGACTHHSPPNACTSKSEDTTGRLRSRSRPLARRCRVLPFECPVIQ